MRFVSSVLVVCFAHAVHAQSPTRERAFVPPPRVAGFDKCVAADVAIIVDGTLDVVLETVGSRQDLDIATPASTRELRGARQQKAALECGSLSCATESARTIRARYFLTTLLERIGSHIIITVSLIDTQEQTVKTGQVDCTDPEDFEDAVQSAARDALGLQSNAAPSSATRTAARSIHSPATTHVTRLSLL